MITDIDKGYDALMSMLTDIVKKDIYVGIHQEEGVKVDGDDSATLAEIATFNEFGTRHIPMRSFLRSTIDENQSKYIKMIERLAGLAVTSGKDANWVLDMVGLKAKSDVQLKITKLKEPANSPITIALKGSSNPLIDTGRMRASIDWKVK